jgi:uncharacterized protein YaeQ
VALTATVYNFTVELADVGRSVYDTFDLRVARHPSETAEYMLTRVLAYAFEYTDGIAMTDGVSSGDDPAVIVRDLTGRITTWIEVGLPDAARLHRASKHADRVAVYTHRDVRRLLAQYAGQKIHRAEDIPIYAFDRAFIDEAAAQLDRRSRLAITLTEGELYVDLDGRTWQTRVGLSRAASA